MAALRQLRGGVLKKAIWILLFVVAVALLALAFGAGMLFFRPGLVLNPRTLSWAAREVARAGVGDFSWGAVRVSVETPARLRRRVAFDFSSFCAILADQRLEICFRKAALAFTADLASFPPRLAEVGPVRLSGGVLTVHPSPAAAHETPAPAPPRAAHPFSFDLAAYLPFWLGQAPLRDVSAELESIRLPGLDGRWSAQGTVALARAARSWHGPWRTGLELAGRPRRGETIRLSAAGALSPAGYRGRLQGSARNPVPRVRGARLGNCALDLDPVRNGPSSVKLRLDCPVRLDIPLPALATPFLKDGQVKLPAIAEVRVRADLESAFPPGPETEVRGKASAELAPVITSLFEGRGRADLRLDGVPSEFPRGRAMEGTLEADFRVPRFERVVERLENGPWAIPAPFNALRGSLNLELTGGANPEGGELPMRLTTRLSSRTQKLDLDGRGTARFERRKSGLAGRFDADLSLSEVQLELPRLGLESPPALVPDERFHPINRAEFAGTAAPPFTYHADVRTPPARFAHLLSNLAKAPVPVELRLSLGTLQTVTGFVRVADFPVRLFRRDASVERFRLTFAPEEKPIDGAIRVAYTDYTIHVLLSGNTLHPRIHLTSDPPLPEQQLVAVLFFGKPLEELDPDQAGSAGRAQAALTDGAISLASLYVLASTPVESIGYDPATGIFLAKVRLSAGTSLNIGAEPGQLQSVGISRRLSRRWRITTALARPGGTAQDRGLSAFLEWTNRY